MQNGFLLFILIAPFASVKGFFPLIIQDSASHVNAVSSPFYGLLYRIAIEKEQTFNIEIIFSCWRFDHFTSGEWDTILSLFQTDGEWIDRREESTPFTVMKLRTPKRLTRSFTMPLSFMRPYPRKSACHGVLNNVSPITKIRNLPTKHHFFIIPHLPPFCNGDL